jgi:predicted mannosyl-3-phosphoglycerate phosphatase (HAD superfamily)
MSVESKAPVSLKDVSNEILDDLLKRVEDIDNCYRSLAEKVGQLYLRADEAGLGELTGLLDKPMRNASDNEQSFAALLDDLRMQRNRQA